ncbi:septum site-determining protein MinC [Candidatus Leptofilum sp.]|uniref:septum site-determining protein MinC n=1 Tax=Candidatus Leptofilum sp. TaxID=3241576 RepID=UPI003B5B25F1
MEQVVSQIGIKGIREGLLVTVPDRGSFADLLTLLKVELAEKQAFLQGSQVALQVGYRNLSKDELQELQALFEQNQLELWAVLAEKPSVREAARELTLATRLSGSQTDLNGNFLWQVVAPETAVSAQNPSQGGLILKETLRSGRSIYHEGHVVIIGDVNPGAEIVASGDVIVWGRLRGLVHAGALGDETAVICALELSPTQLRIANQIAISPEGKRGKAIPEQAAIRNGQIVAEMWQR